MIERGAILESLITDPETLTNEEIKVFLVKTITFVEVTNSKLKMVKRTMYGRCNIQLLRAKMMLDKPGKNG